jgi:hypothetical protein
VSVCLLPLVVAQAGAQDPGEADARARALEERVAALEAALAAQQEAPEKPPVEEEEGSRSPVRAALERVELYGFANASFVLGLARPRGARKEAFPLRVNDTDHQTFSVPYAKVGVRREVEGEGWDLGLGVEVGAGRMVEDVFSLDPDFNGGEEVNLVQGWVDLQLPTRRPLLLRGGRTYGWFGVESLDLPSNDNLSLSYFANFTPYTHTGVSAGVELVDGLRYTQWIVNGWDLVVDQNDAKSYGGHLRWEQGDLPALAAHWLIGAERPSNEHDLRWLAQLDATWEVRDGTTLRASGHYGQEEGAALGGGTAKYGGLLLIARQDLVSFGDDDDDATLYLAGRVAWWRDQGGSKTGRDQALLDTTVTLGLEVLEHGLLRLEWRRDDSTKDDVFLGRRGLPSRDAQETVAIDLSVAF